MLQPPLCMPRSSFDITACASVDSILKDIKTCIRRLQTVFSSFDEEGKVLERIYYKGKNQHRSALFWRHVAGIKRCAQRLSELPDIVVDLRRSFFGELASQKCVLR
jgi:hypothetical protein